MALLEVLKHPHPILRLAGRQVEAVTDDIRRLLDDMAETMYASRGMGLAAPQVGQSLRIFVIDDAQDDEPTRLREFINPVIFAREGAEEAGNEGCLSMPGIRADVRRHRRIGVRALDRRGAPFELWADGILAVAVQHENDHLDGALMTDRLGPLARRLALKGRRG